MKRLSCFAVLVVFCLSIFAISVNPSMDGRAVVADPGIFPPGGYYGRAPGYLPGDTVVVTNHNNGFSIDVQILGTYDAYEGIAILLSQEAADKLQIVKGKDVYVKVQKKQPISYEEAVATSRNKKASQSPVVDTDKDSSVLPGETEELVNEAIASKDNSENSQDEILPVEELETLESEVENIDTVITEVAEVENEETEVVEEIPEEEFIEEENLEVAELEELAEPEDYVESEPIDSPVFDVVEEVEPEQEIQVAEELPVENTEEVVLDDIQNEDFDEADFIDTPVESEIAEVTEEVLPFEEINPKEVSEEIAELEEVTEEDFEDEEFIVLDDIAEVEEEIALEDEAPMEDLEIQEEVAEVEELEDEYLEPVEEVAEEDEFVCEETEVALEEISPAEEVEEVLIPEEEVAEVTPEEEIISPEVLETEAMEEEPELALLEDYVEESTKSVAENPKDIFSMIVGEDLEDDIIEDVVLEESEPKLPELDDSYSEDNAVADLEIQLEEPEVSISENAVEQSPVAVEKNDTSTKSVVSTSKTNIDGFTNIVADFKDLPKVKNAKSSTYYIQIATANKEETVAKIIDLHGKKYPVYVIKNPTKSSYQVLVGPLNDDEYALVLARFKQTYKDAFIRIVK